MNLLQIAPLSAYPPKRGGDHRTHGLVTAFPDEGTQVTRYCQFPARSLGMRPSEARERQIRDDYIEIVGGDLVSSGLYLALPFETPVIVFSGLLLSRGGRKMIREFLARADVVLVEGPWQVDVVAEHADEVPVVYSSHNVEAKRFDPETASSLRAPYYRVAQQIEWKAVSVADAVVCTGPRDEEQLRRRYDPDVPLIVAPNGISESSLKASVDEVTVGRLRDAHNIDPDALVAAFVGSAYDPNVTAARQIIEMAPSLSDRVEFLIIGDVGDEFSDAPSNVTTTGYVDKLDPYLSMADVGLNPITAGGGSNIKMLEYFAHELPVITTPFGSRGFDVTNDTEVVVADVDEFPTVITELTSERRERIGRCAFKYVQRCHVWSQISADLHDRLEELLPR